MIQTDDRFSPGFSLIELLIAMAVASVMMALIMSSFWAQSQIGREQQLIVDMQQNLRSAMYLLERDIMMAGYDRDPDDSVTATITTANPQLLVFQYVDDATGNVATVTYDLYDALSNGIMDIGRSFNPGDGTTPTKGAVAENIQNLEFYYTLADGTRATTITDNPATPQNELDQIRSVGISILARTRYPVRALNNRTYKTLSGVTWGPYNDHLQRQIIKVVIDCRNMR